MTGEKNILRQRDILKLRKDPVLMSAYFSVKDAGVDIHLVGGAVRNLVSRFPIGLDYDLVLTSRVKEISQKLASLLEGSLFLLDKKAGSYRIVVKEDDIKLTVDLSPLKGRTIIEDLYMRDFTINAMAVNIKELFEKDIVKIIDQLNGIRDSKKRCITLIKDTTFEDDPVRLLRAYRLSAQYGFSINKDTENIIKANARFLKRASWERIRDEFFLILNCHNTVVHLKRLYNTGLLAEIFPEIRDWEILREYDLFSHSVRAVTEGERLLYEIKDFVPEYAFSVSSHFDSVVENITRAGLFKLGIFLHDIGKAITIKIDGARMRFIRHDLEGETIVKRIIKRLKLGKKAARTLCNLVRNHHRIFTIASMEKIPYRTKTHLFRVMEGDSIDLLFLAVADARATRGSEDYRLVQIVRELMDFYFRVYNIKKQPPLLRGTDVMRLFNVPQGIMVGRILKRIEDAEGEGIIKNRKEAVEFIKRWLADGAKGIDI